jgi:hypothetical protein
MNTRRIRLAGAVLAMSTLSACSMWQGMTDRITGRGGPSDTARTTRSSSPPGPSGGAWSGGAGMPPGATGASSGASGAGGTAMAPAAMPGIDTSRMRGPTIPATSGRGTPTFRSYNECRAWLAGQGREAHRGPAFGGEASMVDTDPCRDMPRS